MLVSLNEVLRDAKKNKYAVGLFNTVNLEMAVGVLAAAEELRSPVIIGSAECLLCYSGLDDLANMLLPMAKRASVPVVLHFDHGLTEENVKKAIALGFSSVMYDCSTLGFEENLEAVKGICDYAHSKGITVEAEIGHVGTDEICAPADAYTDPEEAKRFAEFTGCDALAIAVGTSHGNDYYLVDPVAACVDNAKWQLAILFSLLENGAEEARRILAAFKPQFESAEAFLAYMDSLYDEGDRITYTEEGATARL